MTDPTNSKGSAMKNLSILGALVLLTLGVAIAGATPAGATNTEQVCAGLDSGKIDTVGDPATVTITATPGYEITGYCIKAGSTKQGNGPVYIPVNPPKTSITVGHPSGKDVSHYSWSESKIPTTTVPPTTEPPVTTQPPTTEPPVTTTPETTVVTTAPPTTETPSTEPPVVSIGTAPPPPSVPTVQPTTPTPDGPPSTPTLPSTGSETWIAFLAAGFLAAGLGITGLARRR